MLMSRKLYQIAYEDKQDPQVFTVVSVLEIFMKSVFAGVCVTDEKANYSHYVIWPLLDTIIAIVDELKFHLVNIVQDLLTRDFPEETSAAICTTNLMAVFRLSLMVFISS
ncbi:unnamed protein product [Mucor circinelloides]